MLKGCSCFTAGKIEMLPQRKHSCCTRTLRLRVMSYPRHSKTAAHCNDGLRAGGMPSEVCRRGHVEPAQTCSGLQWHPAYKPRTHCRLLATCSGTRTGALVLGSGSKAPVGPTSFRGGKPAFWAAAHNALT